MLRVRRKKYCAFFELISSYSEGKVNIKYQVTHQMSSFCYIALMYTDCAAVTKHRSFSYGYGCAVLYCVDLCNTAVQIDFHQSDCLSIPQFDLTLPQKKYYNLIYALRFKWDVQEEKKFGLAHSQDRPALPSLGPSEFRPEAP